MHRIRSFYLQAKEANHKLQLGDNIAQSVFSEAIFKKNADIQEINHWVHAKDTFNNQIYLISRTPSNGINILLGHINAEGLASAVGALPTSEVFRAMTNKGFAPNDILNAINAKLHSLLPENMNLSAIFLNIDAELQYATIFNCNLPDVLVLDSKDHSIIHKISSIGYALGDREKFSFDNTSEQIAIEKSHVILFNSVSISQQALLENYENISRKGCESGDILNCLKESYSQVLDSTTKFNNLSQ